MRTADLIVMTNDEGVFKNRIWLRNLGDELKEH